MAPKLDLLCDRRSILRILSIALCINVATLCGIAYPLTGSKADYWFSDDGQMSVWVALPFAAVGWIALTSISMLLVLVIRGSYHPGIDVALDLINWGIAWAMGFGLIGFISSPETPTQLGCGDGRPLRCKQAKQLEGLGYSAGILLIFAGGIHLALVALACIAIHKERMLEKQMAFHEMGTVGRRSKRSSGNRGDDNAAKVMSE